MHKANGEAERTSKVAPIFGVILPGDVEWRDRESVVRSYTFGFSSKRARSALRTILFLEDHRPEVILIGVSCKSGGRPDVQPVFRGSSLPFEPESPRLGRPNGADTSGIHKRGGVPPVPLQMLVYPCF